MTQKLFRDDLYFRVAVVTLHVPPLRKRPDDIPPLALHFLKELSQSYGRTIEGFTPQVTEILLGYAWPGNVRELRNVIERAVSLAAKPMIREEDLPAQLQSGSIRRGPVVEAKETYDIAKARLLDQFQSQYFSQLLTEEKGNISRVAIRAGVDRKTVYRILNSVGLAKSAE
ncbi:MAG: sigma-54-dependent Fis family transcriptional regulator [bacterium]|nr:sigma-54-dependent Fis family transcriptional regulator [bacterium]